MRLLEAGASKDEVFERTGHVVAVRDADFEVYRGEIFVVMGLSGSGKSTLVRMVNRLIEPTAGRLRLDGRDLTAMSGQELREVRRHDVTMVFQSFALMPHLSNLRNAAFGLEVAGVGRREREARAHAALETVGLGAYAESYPHELSGGMQQRVGLARALAVEPGVLLMDEAFSALDPLIRLEMQDELLRIQDERELTVMFISHDLDEALHIGDRLAIMHDGSIVQTGTAQELISNPASDYVRAFFGNVNLTKVFTAGDLARLEPGRVLRTSDGIPGALGKLERAGAGHGCLIDRDGRFVGIVSPAALREEQRRGGRDLRRAVGARPRTLDAEAQIDACLGIVADTPYPVPVLRDGRFVGTIDRRRLLQALERERPA